MEKTNDITIPSEFLEPPKKKFNPLDNLKKGKKAIKDNEIPDMRTRLSRMNRTVKCIYCEQERILNPDQYQSYYDYWGDEDKIVKNFICKPCEVAMNENPFKFWTIYSELTRKLNKGLKAAFEQFRVSSRSYEDEVSLTSMIVHFLKEANINASPNLLENKHLDFIIESNLVRGIKIKNVPFVGTIELTPYGEEKIKISQ